MYMKGGLSRLSEHRRTDCAKLRHYANDKVEFCPTRGTTFGKLLRRVGKFYDTLSKIFKEVEKKTGPVGLAKCSNIRGKYFRMFGL